MPYEVHEKQLPDQQVAAIRKRVPVSQIPAAMQDGFAKLGAAISQSGVGWAGEPFVIYHTFDPNAPEWEMEVCAPVDRPLGSEGEVYCRLLDGGPVAWTMHHGPYEQVEPAYDALMSWTREHGRQIAGPPRENYRNDPRDVAPEEIETEIDWPIA
jgi:effector-binding domain-containing protein